MSESVMPASLMIKGIRLSCVALRVISRDSDGRPMDVTLIHNDTSPEIVPGDVLFIAYVPEKSIEKHR